jgi:hypothetical protein
MNLENYSTGLKMIPQTMANNRHTDNGIHSIMRGTQALMGVNMVENASIGITSNGN